MSTSRARRRFVRGHLFRGAQDGGAAVAHALDPAARSARRTAWSRRGHSAASPASPTPGPARAAAGGAVQQHAVAVAGAGLMNHDVPAFDSDADRGPQRPVEHRAQLWDVADLLLGESAYVGARRAADRSRLRFLGHGPIMHQPSTGPMPSITLACSASEADRQPGVVLGEPGGAGLARGDPAQLGRAAAARRTGRRWCAASWSSTRRSGCSARPGAARCRSRRRPGGRRPCGAGRRGPARAGATSATARLSPLAPVGGTMWAASPARKSRPCRIGVCTNERIGSTLLSVIGPGRQLPAVLAVAEPGRERRPRSGRRTSRRRRCRWAPAGRAARPSPSASSASRSRRGARRRSARRSTARRRRGCRARSRGRSSPTVRRTPSGTPSRLRPERAVAADDHVGRRAAARRPPRR